MSRLTFRPLTSADWADFKSLFGPRGACGGCWCMWWRLSRPAYDAGRGDGNRRAMKKLVDGDAVTGVLAYEDGRAIGWCSVAPRGDFPRLQRSRVLAPVDDTPVWSVVCFYVAKEHRHAGVTDKLLDAAVRFAKSKGARVVEGYPVEPGPEGTADAFAFTGLASVFKRAGFVEAARRSPRRAVYRLTRRSLPR